MNQLTVTWTLPPSLTVGPIKLATESKGGGVAIGNPDSVNSININSINTFQLIEQHLAKVSKGGQQREQQDLLNKHREQPTTSTFTDEQHI